MYSEQDMNKIWSPNKRSLEGKSTHWNRKMDTRENLIKDIPLEVMNEYRDVRTS